MSVDPLDVAVGYLVSKGFDLDDAEETVKSYDLSEMDFDEVSFVPKGANQKAHVVLWKSDSTQDTDPTRLEVMRKLEDMRKHVGKLLLEKRAKARLSELRKADPMTSYEQAVTVVLDEDPDLYQP